MEWLSHAVSLSNIFTFICAVFAYVVIRPLNQTLSRLEKAVEKLTEEQQNTREIQHRMEGELRELKYAVQKAHDRIDAFLKEQAQHVQPH